ncbi:MAG: PilZ domain-containing protein [Patescibacteria group bacterium]
MKTTLLELNGVKIGLDRLFLTYIDKTDNPARVEHALVFDATKEKISIDVGNNNADPFAGSAVEVYGKNPDGKNYLLKAVVSNIYRSELLNGAKVWELSAPFEIQLVHRRESFRLQVSLPVEICWILKDNNKKNMVKGVAVDMSFSGCRVHIVSENLEKLEKEDRLVALLSPEASKRVRFAVPDGFIESQTRFVVRSASSLSVTTKVIKKATEKKKIQVELSLLEGFPIYLASYRFHTYRTNSRILVLMFSFVEIDLVTQLMMFLEKQYLQRIGKFGR